MDAREWEESHQSHRPSIKRPWDEIAIIGTESSHGRNGRLPPIEVVSYGMSSPGGKEDDNSSYDQYGLAEARGETVKRGRYDRHDYSILSRENLDLNGIMLQAQSSISARSPMRAALDSAAFSQAQKDEGWEGIVARVETADPPNTITYLCRQCRRLTTQQLDAEVSGFREDCSGDSALASAMKEAATTLTKLAIKLSPSEERDEAWDPYPPITQVGVKQSFNWILNRIHFVSDLVDKVVHHVPAELSHGLERDLLGNGRRTQDDLVDSMKRHLDPVSEQAFRSRNDAAGTTSDAKPYTRRRSLAPVEDGNDPFPGSRLLYGYPGSPLESEGTSLPIMNPPPAPSHQLPSPPARLLPSPASINFPSPSVASYGSVSHPTPLSAHHSSLNTYLPPIGSTQTPDALQTHSAALQHEVSVQKLALSSLQGEHDKLLAAFSKSQLRASTLEKKHAVSDNEINMLSEEKLRLRNQVQELEQNLEELTRSRDGTRQAAVLEGAQYMEIVKKASRLEEMAAEEKKRWNQLKAEMEQKIESLSPERAQAEGQTQTGLKLSAPRLVDGVLTPTSPAGAENQLKVEPRNEPRLAVDPIDIENNPSRELREEVHRLRARCAEVEGALRAIRNESRSMGGILEALNLMRKSTAERAGKALGEPLDDDSDGDANAEEGENTSRAVVQ